jgi:hypothetical protein
MKITLVVTSFRVGIHHGILTIHARHPMFGWSFLRASDRMRA